MDLATADLDDTREGQRHGRLAGACATNDTHLDTRAHVKGQVTERELRVGSVSQRNIVEGKLALGWPVLVLDLRLVSFLLRDQVQIE